MNLRKSGESIPLIVHKNRNFILKLSVVNGLFLVLLSVALLFIFPQKAKNMASGFKTPILYFEFIHTEKEVKLFFENGDPFISDMDRGNQLDFLFMLVYNSFLFFIIYYRLKLGAARKVIFLGILPFFTLIFDFLENLQLLGLSSAFRKQGDMKPALEYLKIFTHLKWGSLTLLFAAFSFLFFDQYKKKSIPILVLKWNGVFSFVLFLFIVFERSFFNELLGFMVAIEFLFLWIYLLFELKHSVPFESRGA